MVSARSYTRVTFALDIVRRLDTEPWAGYHELGIVKRLVDLHDRVTVEDARHMSVACDDPRVPCDPTNLCWKATDAVREECGVDASVRIEITKRIPVMGGLAGGSANAATVIALLDKLWGLELDTESLCRIGRRVGMDVPFYFVGKAAFDTETGPLPQPIETSLHFDLVLALPDFGVSTKQAYEGIDYSATGRSTDRTVAVIAALRTGDRDGVIAGVHNDFEDSVFRSHAALGTLKGRMLDAGCETAVLSGSGSTMVGIAPSRDEADAIAGRLDVRTVVVSTFDSSLSVRAGGLADGR